MTTPFDKYLQTRAVTGPWRLEGCPGDDFAGAVVIPALAEEASLFATLASLAANPHELRARFLVLVVVNHRDDAAAADKADNRRLLTRLAAGEAPPGLCLAWIDAASPGRELPAKGGGVGLARKLGCDLALTRLAAHGAQLLVSLDADTLVEPGYLAALLGHFASHRAGGAVLPFCHQAAPDPAAEAAIVRYELFLRSYVLGLALAGSPYAYHSVGSALACRAGAYVRAGGMNRRAAGEDFYFLQQLAKTAGVAPLRGTTVYPSPRPSQRTPFGTGRSVARLAAGESAAVLFHPPQTFRLLADWLALAESSWQGEATELLARAQELSEHLATFLRGAGLAEVWPKLQRHHPRREPFCAAFHGWFDGLRTVQLIHHLCAGPWPRCEPQAALPELLAWAGLPTPRDPGEQLLILRSHQNN